MVLKKMRMLDSVMVYFGWLEDVLILMFTYRKD